MKPSHYLNIEIDWRKLLSNLASRNIGIRDVANITMTPAQTLAELSKRKMTEPPFSVGIRLLDLHYDRCPDLHQALMVWDHGRLN